jgi:carboxypeptidase T
MKKILLALGLVALGTCAFAQNYARVRVALDDRPIGELARLGIETDHGDYEPRVHLTTDLSYEELQLVREAGFRTTILIADVEDWYARQLADGLTRLEERNNDESCGSGFGSDIGPYPTPANYTYGSMGGYHTYAQMLEVLDSMHARYPDLITARAVISDTLLTHEGRPLFWVKISDNPTTDDAAEPEMLYTALHHAREPNGLSQMIFYMWYLLENYAQKPDIQYLLNNTELYFIPCINPDGYIFNENNEPNGGGNWRKNRRQNSNGSRGVDLNRNYGYEWGIDDEGSSPSPNSGTYRGPNPFSEPETRLVRDFCSTHDFAYALNYHTFSNLMIYPWGYNDQVAEPAFPIMADLLVRENNYRPGTASVTVGYAVNGTSDDWMYAERDVLAFTPEVGPATFGFWPPADTIDGLNKAAMWSNLSAAWSLLRFGVATDLSDNELKTKQFDLPVEVRRYGLADGPLTVSVVAISPNATVIAPGFANLTLAHLAVDTINLPIKMDDNAAFGDELLIGLTIDNGFFSRTDTLRKIYYGGPRVPTFEDAFTDAQNWSGAWQLTTEDFISAPSSMTDSPNGDYLPDQISILDLVAPISLPSHAVNPRLQFWARWHLENGYDWVQLEAVDPNSGTGDLLCGLYTRPGFEQEPVGLPVYGGFQPVWKEECIDLSAYAGQTIALRFSLFSDNMIELDGFLFDDLRVSYLDTTLSRVVTLPVGEFRLLPPQPNPAHQISSIGWKSAPDEADQVANILIFNGLGHVVFEKNVALGSRKTAVDTRTWPAGLYHVLLRTERGQSIPQTLSVQH